MFTYQEVEATPKPFTVSSGSLEAIKWLALVIMVADHINRFVYNGTLPGVTECGRLALPMFAFVFGYNLARPGALNRGTYKRTVLKTAIAGVVASIPMMALYGLWPLNIMLLFTLCAGVIWLREIGGFGNVLGFILVLVGGALVEFWWPGVFVALTAWLYCKYPSYKTQVAFAVATASLIFVNGNMWALAAIPVLLLLSQLKIQIPRWPLAFYVLYPLHLVVIWLYLVGEGH